MHHGLTTGYIIGRLHHRLHRGLHHGLRCRPQPRLHQERPPRPQRRPQRRLHFGLDPQRKPQHGPTTGFTIGHSAGSSVGYIPCWTVLIYTASSLPLILFAISRLHTMLTYIMSFAVGTHATVAALAVSLLALTYSTAALLGQYLAAADGYRRSRPSVLGPWAKLARSRWNWTQFRFERLFVVPEIVITRWTDIDNDMKPSTQTKTLEPVESALVTGSAVSRERTLVPASSGSVDTSEVVSWVDMLESVHRHESSLNISGYYRALPVPERSPPAIRFRQRSWHSMPPDITRPLALSTISGIAILARRLGMTWIDFRTYNFFYPSRLCAFPLPSLFDCGRSSRRDTSS